MRLESLKDEMENLTQQAEQSRNEISWWRDRCRALEKEVSVERSAKEALVKEFRLSVGNTAKSDAVPLPPRVSTRRTRAAQPTEKPLDTPSYNDENERGNVPLGCSNCSSAHCQCIEDAFAMPGVQQQKPVSEPQSDSSRQTHAAPEVKPEPEEMEIDFTSQYAGTQSQPETSTAVSSPPMDPCGFCQDGTPCLCAEMAAPEDRETRHTHESNRLAPIQNLSQFTPPPSDGDVRSEVTLPSIGEATNPCANGPGTCAQCRADPRSTLFCKSLAAARSSSGAPATGCCGGKGEGGSCCQTQARKLNPSRAELNPPSTTQIQPQSAPTSASASQSQSLTLSCADTFTTLSRHPNFTRASDELSTWLPKLHPLPNPRDLPPVEASRAAMEVEAASVMGVLRYFDRRFADK